MKGRAVVLLSFLSALSSCNDASNSEMGVSGSDPYIQALRAMMNAQGCSSPNVRGASWKPSDSERARITREVDELEVSLKQGEARAVSKGLDDYLHSARETLRRSIEAEFNTACYPNEEEAFRRAHVAIEAFRDHVNRLSAAHP